MRRTRQAGSFLRGGGQTLLLGCTMEKTSEAMRANPVAATAKKTR